MSDEYMLGTATTDAIANLERLRQQASLAKTPIFDVVVFASRAPVGH